MPVKKCNFCYKIYYVKTYDLILQNIVVSTLIKKYCIVYRRFILNNIDFLLIASEKVKTFAIKKKKKKKKTNTKQISIFINLHFWTIWLL